jgi:hypothetical protein
MFHFQKSRPAERTGDNRPVMIPGGVGFAARPGKDYNERGGNAGA